MTQTRVRAPLRIGACLSLTGRYARFGTQAAAGLEAWRRLDGGADLVLEDDGGDPARLMSILRDVARRSDLLLGPYSTRLTRAAVEVVHEEGGLVWNHGGAGDDVQAAAPGHVVSVLTPASRYAEPFLHLLEHHPVRRSLCLAEGTGSFARQVCSGLRETARRLGHKTGAGDPQPGCDLFCAGSFEEDVAAVTRARGLRPPPVRICAVGAGVREFGDAVARPAGILGVAQWFPGAGAAVDTGPAEDELLRAYAELRDAPPDYPAVQAVAAAAIAVRCARTAGGLDRDSLWTAATALECTTLFGAFRIDPVSGVQLGHETVLVEWTANRRLRRGTAS